MEKEYKKIEKEKERMNGKHTIKDTFKEIIPYVIIIVAVLIVRTYIMTPIKVNGTSMMNTLEHGDTMILNKIGMKFNDIKRFQIVVIKDHDSYLIKRIIGLPGETIEYKDGKLLINNKEVKDPYYKNNNTDDFEKTTICDDCYFVMGDNRSNSKDSRLIGNVKEEDILGTTKVIIFPISNIGVAN